MTIDEMLDVLRRNPVALSIRQPWANRILHDGKDIENRDWPTLFRGPVLIHAGKKPDGCYDRDEVAGMPMGGIVGMVEIVGCVVQSESRWFQGKFGFVLRNATPLAFIPCKGALRFFRPAVNAAILWAIKGIGR